jgi:hypothetical protein
MRRLAEFTRPRPRELVGPSPAPYMRRVRPPKHERRAEAEGDRRNRANSSGEARGESLE